MDMNTPRDFSDLITLYKEQRNNVRLPERYFQVFEYRYGVLDGKSHTPTETAEQFNISRPRVAQMLGKMLDRCEKASDIVF